MKATEQYFPVVLFIMLYKVVVTFESVDRQFYTRSFTRRSYYIDLTLFPFAALHLEAVLLRTAITEPWGQL